ncbi:MAG: hypothetical protein JSV35_03925 [Candidatus Bathyarchaeota archaeon]|nr:MAG: hypothetical protein JSV35_03925 [Candidatus Bathyarchaeota archaeon]
MSEIKRCSPRCNLFKCVKNSAMFRGDSVWCRWTDENCNVANCNYASCVKRRLLPKGVCGQSLKRKTNEKKIEEAVGPPVRVRGKTLRRIGEKEIF